MPPGRDDAKISLLLDLIGHSPHYPAYVLRITLLVGTTRDLVKKGAVMGRGDEALTSADYTRDRRQALPAAVTRFQEQDTSSTCVVDRWGNAFTAASTNHVSVYELA